MMEGAEDARADCSCYVCVDMGTTNTRVWLMRGAKILARSEGSAGVRDTAREGTAERIRRTLKGLIAEVRDSAARTHSSNDPSHIVAAGMITSALGLWEVPHVAAPAGAAELSLGVERRRFEDVSDLPFLLIPGVRSGISGASVSDIHLSDVMRGEETLCIGLLQMGLASGPCVVLNLGSHWKAIAIDSDRRISSSVTSLSGELIHTAQTQTVLASAVPSERPPTIDRDWCEAGMKEERRSGLARALFCVRLLELNNRGTPAERLSFLLGCFIAQDLDVLIRRKILTPERPVLLAGGGSLCAAWSHALEQNGVAGIQLDRPNLESGLLTGLRTIFEGFANRQGASE